MTLPEMVFAGIGALGGGSALIALLTLPATRRKSHADAAAVIQGSAVALLQPLHDEISRLSGEVTELRGQVRTLTAELETARTQLRERGEGTPPRAVRRI